MAQYVDGFVIPIKKKDVKAYKKMCTIGRNIWMKYGALNYYECIGEELTSPYATATFDKVYKLKKDETVIFAFIVYKSKAHRNKVNAKVHKDPMMQPENFDGVMPFDVKRMTMGGFDVLVKPR